MIVNMSRFGTALSTRASGRGAYAFVNSESSGFSVPMEFDFSGVDTVSNSFSDELFGRMAFELGMDRLRTITSFSNVKPLAARIIRSSMDARDSQRNLIPA